MDSHGRQSNPVCMSSWVLWGRAADGASFWLRAKLESSRNLRQGSSPAGRSSRQAAASALPGGSKLYYMVKSSPRFPRWLAWRRWCLSRGLERRGSNNRMSWSRVPGMPRACRLRIFLHSSRCAAKHSVDLDFYHRGTLIDQQFGIAHFLVAHFARGESGFFETPGNDYLP